MENIIISDQFAYNMAPWLNEKTEYVIKDLLNIKEILISNYSYKRGVDKFLAHRFPLVLCPDKKYMEEIFSSCNFQNDRGL